MDGDSFWGQANDFKETAIYKGNKTCQRSDCLITFIARSCMRAWRHLAFVTWLTTSKWAINKRLTTESVACTVVVECVDKITAFNRKMTICCLHWLFFMMSAQSSGLLPPDEVKMSCKSVNVPVWVWLWNWPLLSSFCSVGRFAHICRSLGSVAWKIPYSL